MATKTKKPAAKKTAVVKAHRGMAHVPRGRRRPLNPRQRPQVEPRRRGDDRPIRAPGIDRPQMPRGRNPRVMTPAMRRQMELARRRFNFNLQRRRRRPTGTPLVPQAQPTPRVPQAQPTPRVPQAQPTPTPRRRRRPTGTLVPKVATPRKRPTGTPRGPQVTPRRRRFRFRGRR